ncbi:LOW QUALITY PROTEIN: disease resistance protein RPV1-like [Argentina anserina]|uniref:LOW QUALITY PROTEIN: disease resistance protein RPV1-like n=1 Tax=Argentina anserina TaxID=57926 RepID=UPI00217681D9|nr:LOW QUALITY PROTEIN: disease resistance protein RPV1-like [Potentilla anserina]
MDMPSSSSSNTQTVPSSSSSVSPSTWKYDVFLSFRGEDSRNSFTDHLHYALNQRGINVFRDTEKLQKGKSISPELLKAIEESRFVVAVLSPNYATSSWCLDELAHIVKCNKLRGLEVLPVFYHVEPSEIRKQTGNYGEAFAEHQTNFKDNITKVDNWREALKEVVNLSGWHVTYNRGESEVIQEIAKRIWDICYSVLYEPDTDLIGMDARIEMMESYLDLRSSDVFAVGIWGMGGSGKSTLAKEVFYKMKRDERFDVSGFVSISNGSSYSEKEALVELQKLLCGSFFGDSDINIDTVGRGIKMLKRVLYKKKVLIVLDNVDELDELKGLAPGMQDEENSWASGSRLIITTRDRRTLTECLVREDKIYEIEKLNEEEASQLLCQKAFKKNDPPYGFEELSKRFLKYADGLPLALKVLGSHLSGRKAEIWSEVLDRHDKDLDKGILKVLQISFDGLEDTDKEIFLDIACFFNGEDKSRVGKILNGCGFTFEYGIKHLVEKSLIKIQRGKLWMHDLLRWLGWHIVCNKSYTPGERCRLWLDDNAGRSSWRFEDACNMVVNNQGTNAVEGLFLSLPEKEIMSLKDDPFSNLSNLRLLKIYNVNFPDVQFRYVSKKLRLLEWHECPLEFLPSEFTSENLVEIKMPNSRIKQLWNGTLSLEKLILMDLSHCQSLATTPDFSKVPNLERLILEGCTELSVVHPSVGALKKLDLLNLKGCASLESLPYSISMTSLRIFILSGCSKLKQFPEFVENMDALAELYLNGTAIQELPVSIQFLKGLVLLNLSGCRNLHELPSILCSSLTSMKFLYLSLCSSMENLPDNIGCLEYLEELDACYTAIKKVPKSICLLKNLKLLYFMAALDSQV